MSDFLTTLKSSLNDPTLSSLQKELIEKTIHELSQKSQPISQTRVWTDPNGFQYLAVWQNAALLRVLVRKFTSTLPRREFRTKPQMDDAARSVKRNIEEGWKRATTSEYLQFLSYSQGSLEEVKGDLRDCKTDGFLKSSPNSSLMDMGLDLRVVKGPKKGNAWGEPTDPTHPYYKALSTLKSETLNYEILMELANKTDWLLRKLVGSLEKKLMKEKKGYQIDKARMRSNLKLK